MSDAGALLEMTRTVGASLDLKEVLRSSIAALRAVAPRADAAIELVEDDGLVVAARDPLAPVRPAPGASIRLPLVADGATIGAVRLDALDRDAFDDETTATLGALARTIAAAVQNALLFEQQRRALEEAREAVWQKRECIAIVAHEFRTPLTSIAGFGKTLSAHAPDLDGATIADIGERVWRASRRVMRIVGDLVDLSDLEQATLTVRNEPTAVAPVLRDAVDEQQSDTHPISLSVEPALPAVHADAERLHQVIGNLLSNARKFSPPGAPIEVRATAHDHVVTVSVIDHGRGIPRAIHARVFERFFRTPDDDAGVDGMGIGLYLVKQLCERMHARVVLDSEPGTGTRVSVLLRVSA